MSIEHQPHATATFFELAVALSVLAWRTFCSLDHLPDPPQNETERIIQQLEISGRVKGLTIIHHNKIWKWLGKFLIILVILLSVGGLVFFGTGWLELNAGFLFWFAFVCFLAAALAAAKAETARMRRYTDPEKVAAKTLEKFSTGE